MGIGNLGASGLILGWFTGQLFTTGLFGWQTWKEDHGLFSAVSIRAIKQQAVRHQDFPKFLVPSGLVESASGQFPSILLSSLFGATTLGFFSLAMRVINLPMSLISGSIRDVFWQSASRDFVRIGNCRTVFIETFKKLVLLSIIPSIAIFFLSPILFVLIFGAKWRIAGEYAQIMAVMFLLRFISNPLSSMFYIAEKQKWDLVIQASLFVVVVTCLIGVSHLTENPKAAVIIYTVIYALKYILELYLSYQFSQKSQV
jgi:O-antigen/teichoic acid export membrane protein